MKKICLLIATLSLNRSMACTTCNRQLQDAIYDSTFYPNLLIMLSAFFVLALIVVFLSWLSARKYRHLSSQSPSYKTLNPVPLTTASMVLGIGMGGFIDGIWLHQILQWHEMLSNKVTLKTLMGKSVNMFWDGVFHLFCWVVVLTGIVLLWKLLSRRDINRSGSLLSGGLLLGWGLFNIVEGIIDHHLLKLHFVRQRSLDPDYENFAFLGFSVLLIFIGWIMVHKRAHYRSPLKEI
ncbi:MAG: hypothetical protein K0S23_32 [Fluviicola sp.]|jgi:uncharacterized membrane protein|uniref:DUF2243 domain-containing protein n=1 Tax=Fluviicola sp. TaxID=1917219 RepID=UPI0026130A70|nr:DUF2243 domain-containing protein [Fluviicola sp.]MDF3025725.1 hypothetical protein [Fluviicola sp.]